MKSHDRATRPKPVVPLAPGGIRPDAVRAALREGDGPTDASSDGDGQP